MKYIAFQKKREGAEAVSGVIFRDGLFGFSGCI